MFKVGDDLRDAVRHIQAHSDIVRHSSMLEAISKHDDTFDANENEHSASYCFGAKTVLIRRFWRQKGCVTFQFSEVSEVFGILQSLRMLFTAVNSLLRNFIHFGAKNMRLTQLALCPYSVMKLVLILCAA